MKAVRIHPTPQLQGTLRVSGDKSISHRAVMFASLGRGESRIKGLLLSEDVRATLGCFQAMGVSMEIKELEVRIQGVGLTGLKAPSGTLDCGNSGTTLRLMMGILAGQPFTSRLTGDASLNRRPIDRVANPLRAMGAQVEELRHSETERVVRIEGRPLRGISYQLPIPSAQVKSAILLAGLWAQGTTRIDSPVPSRDHTEILMQHLGIPLKKAGTRLELTSPQPWEGFQTRVPGDISSAAFFLVGGCLGPGSRIRLEEIGVNPTRTGVLEVLQDMGAKLKIQPKGQVSGEEVADLEVEFSSLKATRIGGTLIPRLIDEIPILSVAAAAAQGVTEIHDAAELRVKETDRIATVEQEFRKFGMDIEGLPDGLKIYGPKPFQSGKAQSRGDHRIAMSLAIAATQGRSESEIDDVKCVQTSYPEFFNHLKSVGGRVEAI